MRRALPGIGVLLLALVCFGGDPALADDDACEGREDEPCDTGQPGICAAGRLDCHDDELRCKRREDPRPENCGNQLDDDCDGATDAEDSSCGPAPCPDRDGDHWAVCGGGCAPDGDDQCGDCDDGRQSVSPGRREDCDNDRDDDCDGATDAEDSSCGPAPCPDRDGDHWAVCGGGCAPDGGDQCGDCDDGRASVNPSRAEACNGRDDDCDDSVDEGNPGGGDSCHTGEPGICDAGTRVCAAGGLHCASNLAPRAEDCDNGLDDDCNGKRDENDPLCQADCGSTLDGDGDRVADCADNCRGVANTQQRDFDADGMGDDCESGARLCDVDRSGRVDGRDLALLGSSFGRSCGDGGFDPRADLTRDCHVDGDDLALLASLFGQS